MSSLDDDQNDGADGRISSIMPEFDLNDEFNAWFEKYQHSTDISRLSSFVTLLYSCII